jgi:hypothetical protein
MSGRSSPQPPTYPNYVQKQLESKYRIAAGRCAAPTMRCLRSALRTAESPFEALDQAAYAPAIRSLHPCIPNNASAAATSLLRFLIPRRHPKHAPEWMEDVDRDGDSDVEWWMIPPM